MDTSTLKENTRQIGRLDAKRSVKSVKTATIWSTESAYLAKIITKMSEMTIHTVSRRTSMESAVNAPTERSWTEMEYVLQCQTIVRLGMKKQESAHAVILGIPWLRDNVFWRIEGK